MSIETITTRDPEAAAHPVGSHDRLPNRDRPVEVVVTVCTSCRPAETPRETAPGRALWEAVAARAAATGSASRVRVRPSQCLSVCKRICTAAISGEGGYTYVFGDLDPATAAEPLLALAHQVAAAPHGHVPWKERPEPLRRGLIARVPPPGWSPADGSPPA